MKYRTEIYFQKERGVAHKLVTPQELRDVIGADLADRQISIAEGRINTARIGGESIPELTAFFRGDKATALALANYTARGNVWIEVVTV